MAALVSSSATSSSPSNKPPFYFDEKWKMTSKKQSLHPHRRCSFTRKCAKLVKEQRARFYIVRRCVTMLICWHDYTDS